MKAQGRAVLIKPDNLPGRTKEGMLVPETSKEMLPQWGELVDVGSACKEAKIGLRVKFSRKGSSVIVIEGKDYYFTYEYKLIFIQEKGEEGVIYTLNCDKCGKPFQSNMAFPDPHICPSCYI